MPSQIPCQSKLSESGRVYRVSFARKDITTRPLGTTNSIPNDLCEQGGQGLEPRLRKPGMCCSGVCKCHLPLPRRTWEMDPPGSPDSHSHSSRAVPHITMLGWSCPCRLSVFVLSCMIPPLCHYICWFIFDYCCLPDLCWLGLMIILAEGCSYRVLLLWKCGGARHLFHLDYYPLYAYEQ